MLLREQVEIDSQYDWCVSAGIAKVGASAYLFPVDISDTAGSPRSEIRSLFRAQEVKSLLS